MDFASMCLCFRVLADVEHKKEQLRARATEHESEKPLVLICKPVAWRMGDLDSNSCL